MARPLSRSLVKFILAAVMAVCLPIALAGEAVALVFDHQPVGAEVGTVADASGWLFAAAFLVIFLLVLVEQDRAMRARRRPRPASSALH